MVTSCCFSLLSAPHTPIIGNQPNFTHLCPPSFKQLCLSNLCNQLSSIPLAWPCVWPGLVPWVIWVWILGFGDLEIWIWVFGFGSCVFLLWLSGPDAHLFLDLPLLSPCDCVCFDALSPASRPYFSGSWRRWYPAGSSSAVHVLFHPVSIDHNTGCQSCVSRLQPWPPLILQPYGLRTSCSTESPPFNNLVTSSSMSPILRITFLKTWKEKLMNTC